jgi:hypothetical protein
MQLGWLSNGPSQGALQHQQEEKMTRIFDIREPSIEALKSAPVYFRYGSNKNRILIDALTANAVLACYNALKDENTKAKFARMVAGSPKQLTKLVEFCWKHVSLS